MHEQVRLDVPLDARYATTVRSVVASLAATLGMSVDDIDDLRLGVNEAISLLTDRGDEPEDDDARLHVAFDTEPGRISVSVRRSGVASTVTDVDGLAQRILDAVVDGWSVDGDGRIELVKRVRPDGDT